MNSKAKKVLQSLRFLMVRWGIHWNNPLVQKDLARWGTIYTISGNDRNVAATLLWDYPEFRNLLIYRHPAGLWKYWFRLLYKPMDTLYILANHIGGGLFIQHGFATMISAESIGENCWINQQVTIGYNGQGRPPVIGDNVMIFCGAKVLGSITVGNSAVIGANAVVIRDVEPGAVMGGVPAHKLR